MATEFSREFFSENRIVKADLRAAHQLRKEDIARIKAEVKKLYDATEVILNVSVDESLLSGYVLQVGDRVFDNSGRHQLDQMMAGKPSLATLKTRIEDYKPAQTSAEGGVVISSADGIVQVEGMDKAVYGEIVTFENGAKGMVESVDPGKLGIMLFDGAETVGVGTLVTRSGKRAGIPVGDGFLGRVIDPLGEPIDGKGPVNAEGYNPIEKQAPGILERQSVDTPLHTGILAIDSMFPIGRGQRELIIGDRQTGKTSIATDAILNQKYQTAVESQIEMQFCINDLSGIQLSASELVVLLSNLLDNAIEACRRVDAERLIQCTILENDGFFLSIRNTSLPVLITEHGIATTKASASEHGYGLPSVCRILDGLHAEYAYNYEDGWFQFTAEIPSK